MSVMYLLDVMNGTSQNAASIRATMPVLRKYTSRLRSAHTRNNNTAPMPTKNTTMP